jgi:hypothetical protein
MISIHCTHCKQLLEMDDAFAGGVCRCQYCKTIQTVPSNARHRSASAKTSSKSKPAKTLYTTPDSGLDELAQVVASSGLSRKGLAKKPSTTRSEVSDQAESVAAPTKPNASRNVMMIGGGALGAIVLAVVLFLVFKPATPPASPAGQSPDVSSKSPATPDGDGSHAAAPVPHVAGPAFADIPLPGNSVVYLIDRSQANEEVFDTVRAAVNKSILSLGRARRFQIIYWSRTDEGLVSYPEDSLVFATQGEVDTAGKRFEDVIAYGKTELKPTIEKAVRHKPAAVVILTAKGYSLDETDAAAVKTAMTGVSTKIHTVSLGEPGGGAESKVLKDIASQNGGIYRELSPSQLQDYVR